MGEDDGEAPLAEEFGESDVDVDGDAFIEGWRSCMEMHQAH
jgi:hypothetical protein